MKKTIKELDIYISDGNYSSKYPRSEEFVEEGIPFIRGNNMVDGDITDDEMYYITPEKHSLLLKGHVKAGDVLITTRGNIGQVAIVPDRHEDSNINAQIVLLRTNQETLYNRYLLWALQSHGANEQYLALQTGTALKQLPVGKLEKLFIEVTDINKQHEIADILDKTYEVVKLRRKELQLLDDLTKARFVEMFGDIKTNTYGWKKYSLEQLTIKITDGEHGTVPRVNEGEGYLYFMARNITKEGLIDLSETSYVPVDVHQKIYKRCNPEAGDILLVCVGATVGKSALVTEKMGEFSMARSVALIKPDKEKINSLFLLNLLRSDAIQNNISNCVHAAAQAGLYTNMIKNLDAFVPPIELQNQFADFVKQVDKLKLQVQKSLDETQILFDSLMQQYFG